MSKDAFLRAGLAALVLELVFFGFYWVIKRFSAQLPPHLAGGGIAPSESPRPGTPVPGDLKLLSIAKFTWWIAVAFLVLSCILLGVAGFLALSGP